MRNFVNFYKLAIVHSGSMGQYLKSLVQLQERGTRQKRRVGKEGLEFIIEHDPELIGIDFVGITVVP